MSAKTLSILLLILGPSSLGCSGSASDGSDDLVKRLGFSELAIVAPLAPDGFVDFYIGEAVLREYAETGRYVPGDQKPFSLIRVQSSQVEGLRAGSSSNISLCDSAALVTLMNRSVGDNFQPLARDVENCTPWVEYGTGTLTITYQSGASGVYGAVEVGMREDGVLFAGASMSGLLPSACTGDDGLITSAMYLGSARPRVPPGGECSPPQDGSEPHP